MSHTHMPLTRDVPHVAVARVRVDAVMQVPRPAPHGLLTQLSFWVQPVRAGVACRRRGSPSGRCTRSRRSRSTGRCTSPPRRTGSDVALVRGRHALAVRVHEVGVARAGRRGAVGAGRRVRAARIAAARCRCRWCIRRSSCTHCCRRRRRVVRLRRLAARCRRCKRPRCTRRCTGDPSSPSASRGTRPPEHVSLTRARVAVVASRPCCSGSCSRPPCRSCRRCRGSRRRS